jgi:MFS family permease
MRAVILRYHLFAALVNLRLFAPVVLLLYTDRGLELAHVAWLQAWFSIVVIVAEVPTGVLADRLGHRTMLVAGSLSFSASLAMLAVGHTLGAFMTSEALGAIGLAAMSGADKSVLHAAIPPPRRDAIFARTESRARGTAAASQAVGSLVGGVVGATSLRLPVLLSAATLVLAATTALGLPRPSVRASPPAPMRAGWQVRQAWAVLREHVELRQASATFVLLGALQWAGFWLLQPLLLEHEVASIHFGTILAGVLTIVFVASRTIGWVIDRAADRIFGLAALGTACALGLVAAGNDLWVLPLFASISWLEVLMSTAVTTRTLALAPPGQTATVLSVMTAVRRTVYASLMLVVGELVARGDIPIAAATLACLSMLVCAIVVYPRRHGGPGSPPGARSTMGGGPPAHAAA